LKCSADLTKVLENCRKHKIYFSAFWDPISIQQRKYNNSENIDASSNAVNAAKSTIVFKMGDRLSRRSIQSICDIIREVVIE
jgi:dTDP-4-amino-4,6-dideoxygalactose transaminase